MAPKVQVPADFGKHHIGAVSHGNLIFKLKDGVEIKANSMILSLNSPVIDHLTTNLDQQTLDADDFHKDAVDCFIEAAYTGELETINQSNFRDVNKMSWVFEVSWLIGRCAEYFEMLVSQLDDKEYDEILFVVEEARFVCKALKKRTFLELVIGKLASMAIKRNVFIEKYMANFIEFPRNQLDIVIEIVGNDVHVLVQILTSYLESHKRSIDKNTRYLIENIDLSLCWKNNSNTCDALFNALEDIENISKEDYKMLLHVSKQNVCGKTPRSRSRSTHIASVASTKIPNLFHSFAKYMTPPSFENTFNQLAVSEEVSNLYMFFDGLWMLLYQNIDNVKCNELILKRVIAIKEDRSWGTMAYEYLERINYTNLCSPGFVNLIKGCDQLVSRKDHYCVSSSQQYSREEFIDSIFLNRSQVKFKPDTPMLENCSENGNCGIILQTNSASRGEPNMFDIRLVTDSDEYPFDLHLHKSITCATNMHIAIEIYHRNGWTLYPLSWCDKPFCKETEKYWGWGYIQLQPNNNLWLISKKGNLRNWNRMTPLLNTNKNIRFTLFYSLEK